MVRKSNKTILVCVGFFCLALLYRIPGLDHPFWVDEFSSSIQAQLVQSYGLNVFQQQDYYFEYHNITTHFLIALFFSFLGMTEVAARIPTVLFGSLVPVLIFLVGRKVDKPISGVVGALLAIFSYYQIVWSQQARGYMLQQVLLLASLLLYFKIIETKKPSVGLVVSLVIIFLLGVLTHLTFLLPIVVFILHYLYLRRDQIGSVFRVPVVWLAPVLGMLVLVVTGSVDHSLRFFNQLTQLGLSNNIWYYHAFLWREQTLITFLGGVGLVFIFLASPKKNSIFFLLLGIYLFFFGLIFPPYVTRYLLPIFPLLLIGMGAALTRLADQVAAMTNLLVNKRIFSDIISILMVGIIVMNGHTFVTKPNGFYSVNHFMREIPLLNYDLVYAPIQQAIAESDQPVAMIDTWLDRSRWYLGFHYPNLYIYRWADDSGTTNGLPRSTPYEVKEEGVRIIPNTGRPPVRLISEARDLQEVSEQFAIGFIWIDDQTMPVEVREYAERHFEKVLTIDHYPLDDNPHSIWPGTLYKWRSDVE